MRERRRHQFTQPERRNGRPTGQRVQFPLDAPLDSIAAESAGLGFFFRLNRLLRVFLTALCVLALYPLAVNLMFRFSDSARSPSQSYAFVVEATPPIDWADFGRRFHSGALPGGAASWRGYVDALWDARSDRECQKPSVRAGQGWQRLVLAQTTASHSHAPALYMPRSRNWV